MANEDPPQTPPGGPNTGGRMAETGTEPEIRAKIAELRRVRAQISARIIELEESLK